MAGAEDQRGLHLPRGQVGAGNTLRGHGGRPHLAPLLGGAGPGQPRRDGGGPYGGLVLTGINDNNNKTNRSTTSPPTFLPSVASSSGAWLPALIMAPALYSHRLEKRKISIRFQVNLDNLLTHLMLLIMVVIFASKENDHRAQVS